MIQAIDRPINILLYCSFLQQVGNFRPIEQPLNLYYKSQCYNKVSFLKESLCEYVNKK